MTSYTSNQSHTAPVVTTGRSPPIDTTEDRISKRRREVLDDVKKVVRDQLYGYLDNKEFGGLEYVLSRGLICVVILSVTAYCCACQHYTVDEYSA